MALTLTKRRMEIVTVVLFAIGAQACGGRATNSRPPATAASPVDDNAKGLMEHHGYHHHGGVTLFIAMSLDTLGVSPEQRAAVEKIRAELHAELEAARVADQRLVAALADGLSASTFDSTKIDAALTQMTQAVGAAHDASLEALNALHAALTPAQRGALADKVEAHWAVWRQANADEAGTVTDPSDGHLARLARELALTPEQTTEIRRDLAHGKTAPHLDEDEVAAHLRAFGDAFRAETFDAKALGAGAAVNARMARWGAAHLVRVVEVMSPILTQDQRVTLAQKLREHATHGPIGEGSS